MNENTVLISSLIINIYNQCIMMETEFGVLELMCDIPFMQVFVKPISFKGFGEGFSGSFFKSTKVTKQTKWFPFLFKQG